MKVKSAILYLFICLNHFLYAQVETFTALNYGGDTYDVFKVKIDETSIKNFDILENKTGKIHPEFISTINTGQPFFTINASISDSSCNPIGFYYKNGKLLKPVNLNNGTGNFYLKPNGALIFTKKSAVICESSEITNYNDVYLGIQSGPMLLVNGSINHQFNPSSKNKNIRCAVGIASNKNNETFLIFCVSNNPVCFYDISMLLKMKFKCSNALCLESGNCAMNLPYLTSSSEKFSNIICNYLYYAIH